MSICLTNVTKSFGHQNAVNDVSFTLNKGEVTGFLGPNGAGKSTTMKMICGLLFTTDGSIEVNGLNVAENELSVKRSIGYLPEDNPLYLHMYVKEFLSMMADIHNIKNKWGRINFLIQETGLTKEQHKKISTLSKGYRQRLGLAQALLHDPDILILDEPISGLDPNQLVEIRALIKEMSKDKTVLFSSHIMQEVEQLCDRIIIINNGVISLDKSMQELKNRAVGSAIIKIETDKQIAKDLFLDIHGIEDVVQNDRFYSLQCRTEKDLRSEIHQLSILKEFAILEMKMEKLDIENIFQEFTKK